MNFKLIIDKSKPEEIIATVHDRSSLTDRIEQLVMQHSGTDRIAGYREDELRQLPVHEIVCITVLNGKTYAVDIHNQHYRLKQRLYELEQQLPATFIRINKSALANECRLDRFYTAFSGAVDAIFQGGYREYVSRRCFAEIKRRYSK